MEKHRKTCASLVIVPHFLYTSNMSTDQWVCITEAHGQLEGEIYRAKLEANEVPVQVFQESAGVTYGLTVGSLGLVQIFVPMDFKKIACELLNISDSEEPDDE